MYNHYTLTTILAIHWSALLPATRTFGAQYASLLRISTVVCSHLSRARSGQGRRCIRMGTIRFSRFSWVNVIHLQCTWPPSLLRIEQRCKRSDRQEVNRGRSNVDRTHSQQWHNFSVACMQRTSLQSGQVFQFTERSSLILQVPDSGLRLGCFGHGYLGEHKAVERHGSVHQNTRRYALPPQRSLTQQYFESCFDVCVLP